DAAWELEPGAYADLVPVSECSSGANEDSQSTSSSSSSSSSTSTSTSYSVGHTECNRLVQEKELEADKQDSRTVNLDNGYRSSVGSSSTDQEHLPLLTLVWNNQNFRKRRRRKQPTRRQTQITQTIPDTPRSTRISRRQTSMTTRTATRNDHSPNTTNENRLRQVTLGSFLSVKTETSR
ncbi:unnamed protein product, partial [Trichobilharzia regenti]